VLKRADQIWTSDNTNPEARLFIQEGFSLFLPARTMGAWITDNRSRNTIPFSFSSHVAMLGALGIGGNLLHWTDEDMQEVAHWISVYKKIRHLVQDGQQSWLLSPHTHQGNLAAVQYTAPDGKEAVVFAFRRRNILKEPLPLLRLQQLDATASYSISSYPYKGQETSANLSGAALERSGLKIALTNTPYDSTILHLQARQ
jgi:alpha-galactosidase